MNIEFGGEHLTLLPERAFFWDREKLLGLSDIHIGKAQSLQRAGLPVSQEAHAEDLRHIANLVDRFKPDDVVILGDFIHQRDSWSEDLVDQLTAFFTKFPGVQWNLVLGNHERGSDKFLARLPFHLFEREMTRGSLALAHGHAHDFETRIPRIEGHVHPVVMIQEGPTRLRLPCFAMSTDRMIIPSFGTLTGGFEIEKKDYAHVYAVTPKTVFEVKGRG